MTDNFYEEREGEQQAQQTASSGAAPALVFALVFATVAFFSGLSIGTSNQTQAASLFSFFQSDSEPAAEETADLSEFWRVWDLMEEKFAASTSTEPLSVEDRINGAINGLVGSYGDSYSVYLPREDAESFSDDISGNFSGVGMEVGMRDGAIAVIAPLPDTPAEEAGVMAGDIIVEIDGESTERMTIDEAVKRIRGDRGSEVVLTIAREGEMELLDIAITRDNIEIPTIDTELEDGVFVISLYSFNAVAEQRMQEALREYSNSGADKLVLDLRGNPGGFLQSAVNIASFFLPTGNVIVREEFGDGRDDRVFRSQGRTIQDFTAEDMVILVDRGSASASEIVAGALSEHGKATLIGAQTFGKGSVQELVDLPSGASLKVTVARWVTPDGTSISEGGLTPEIEVARTAEQRVADEDPQLDVARQFLLGTFDPSSLEENDEAEAE